MKGCYECSEDCRKGLLGKAKPHGFTSFVKQYGSGELLDCLERNEGQGVVYHREGISGDYDGFEDEEALIQFIKKGSKMCIRDRNIVMKFLATITIVMSIPTMVASLYGMNVNHVGMPFADSPYGFWIVLGFAAVLSGVVAFIFSKKDLF